MPIAEIIDPWSDPKAQQKQILGILLPIVSVALVIGTIAWVSWKNYEVAHTGTILLSKKLMESQQHYIAQKVADYLRPARSSVMLAQDMLDSSSKEQNVSNFKLFTRSILRLSPQADSFYFANQDGELWIVARDGKNFKEIAIEPHADREKALYTQTIVSSEGEKVNHLSKDGVSYTDPRRDNWYAAAVKEAMKQGFPEKKGDAKPASNPIHWTSPYWDPYAHQFLITASTAYPDIHGNTKVFAINISLNQLSDFINSLTIAKTGQAVVVDRNGKVIAGHNMIGLNDTNFDATDVFLNPATQPVFTRALNIFRVNGSGAHIISARKQNYIAIATDLPQAKRNWVLILNAPEKEFANFIQLTKKQNLYSSLAIIILATILSGGIIWQGSRVRRYKKEIKQSKNREKQESSALLKIATVPGLLTPEHEVPILTEILAELTGSSRASIWRLLPNGKALICEDLYDVKKSVHAAGMELESAVNPSLFHALEEGHSLTLEVGGANKNTPGAEGLCRLISQAGATGTVVFYPVLNMHHAIGALTLTAPKHLEQGNLVIALMSAVMSLRFSASVYKASEKNKDILQLEKKNDEKIEREIKRLTGFLIEPHKQEGDNHGIPQPGFYPQVPIMVLRLKRSHSAFQAPDKGTIELVELLAKKIQDICKELSVFALQIAGNRVIFLGECSLKPDEKSIMRLAEASLQIREKCLAILAQKETNLSFSMGLDLGPALVSTLGENPEVFNLWGRALSTAELLADSAPTEGVIQVSSPAYMKLREAYLFRSRGDFYLPDIGVSTSYILAGRW